MDCGPVEKIAVITGGRGDLARSLVEEFSAEGFEILAPDREKLDVAVKDSVNRFFSGLDRIDLLINNAGTVQDRSVTRLTSSDWDRVLSVNLSGAFRCSRKALELMIRQRSGHIVNIGSYSALRPPGGQANYASAKAGLIGLTQSLADEGGKRNVRVNCVLPGFLETKMTGDLDSRVIESARKAHTLGRFNTTADAARFVRFLDSMPAVSGQVFQLDSRLRAWC